MIQKESEATHARFKTQDFCTRFQQWCKCWACCIKLQGNYFNKDTMK